MKDPNFNIEIKCDALKMNKLKKSAVTVREDIKTRCHYITKP